MSERIGRFTGQRAEARFRAAHAEAMALLPAPAGIERVPTRFGRVQVYRFGSDDGVPLVLLPGRNGTTTMWGPLLPGWAARRSVYAVEVLGEAGGSVQDRPIRDTHDQAAWLAETLSGLGLDTAHLVGVSFGGWLATNLAVHGSPVPASLSLLDPVQVFAPMPLRTMVAAVAAMPSSPAALRRRALSWMLSGAEVDRSAAGRVTTVAGEAYRTATPPPALPTGAQLRELRVPTLAVIAGRSRVQHPGRAVERASALLPQASVELLRTATHALTGEFPEWIGARVLEFVEEVDRGVTRRRSA